MNEATFNKKSEKTKVFSLHPTMHSYNAYFDNEFAFCAYHFPYVDEPRLKDQFNGTMFNFVDRLDDMHGGSFERELTNGDVLIFSKSAGRIVDQVFRIDRGDYATFDGKEIPMFYEYYLPDGVLFVDFMNYHCITSKMFEERQRRPMLYRFFGKFLP